MAFKDDVLVVSAGQEACLTTKDVAERLCVHENSVRNWRKSGKLMPAWQTINGHARYTEAQIKDYEKRVAERQAAERAAIEKRKHV